MNATLEEHRQRLQEILRGHARLLIAYSGGIDSAYLAWEAHQVLGDKMLAVIADSPSLPRTHLRAATDFAAEHGIPLRVVQTAEMARPEYVRNDGARCFHCKDELFQTLEAISAETGITTVAYGRNRDDSGDYRPGQQAAEMHHAVAPLAEAELGKAEIRALALAAGLSLWDKPASACLSSRMEYGRPVTVEALRQIEASEEHLLQLGFRQVRVRHHGALARVEIERSELPRALHIEMLAKITEGVRAAGFTYVTLDTEGYRAGSMNALLPVESLLKTITVPGFPMQRDALFAMLTELQSGSRTVDDVAERLAVLPFEDLGFAKIDHHRSLRAGLPEVVFAAGKTPAQTAAILSRLHAAGTPALATHANPETFAATLALVPEAKYHEAARCITCGEPAANPNAGHALVICAGTSDIPVAEEAALTAEFFGARVTRLHDVGVAGLQRLLAHLPLLRSADVLVVCAGMEGALPTVVGGLVPVPVIAVPTSVGYGASFGGVTALLGMLNSCTPNVTVVNIDNGFGAGYTAALYATRRSSF